MAEILIVYGTLEGQTARIAVRLAKFLQARGHRVHTRSYKDQAPGRSPADFDAVIIGASVHYGEHPGAVGDFIKTHLAALQARPAAFFSVSLSAAGSEAERRAARELAEGFVGAAGWRPVLLGVFAGAIAYTRFNLFKRLMMRKILQKAGGPTDTSRDHELTDWRAVERFAAEFLAALPEGGAPPSGGAG